MKTSFLTFALLVSISYGAFSQILVGPEIGGNYSWTSFADKDLKDGFDVTPVFGFSAGGHLAFKVRKRFFLHTSFLYATKGRHLSSDHDPSFKSNSTYHYIDVPIAYTVDFKGKIGQGKEFKYFAGIGPVVSYWLGGKGKFFNIDYEEANRGELSYKIAFDKDEPADNEMAVYDANRVQLGLNFVAGMIFEPAARQRIMFTVRYELGHSYLAKADGVLQNTFYEEPLKVRNQGFRVSLAYLYDLKTEDRKKGKSTIDRRRPK